MKCVQWKYSEVFPQPNGRIWKDLQQWVDECLPQIHVHREPPNVLYLEIGSWQMCWVRVGPDAVTGILIRGDTQGQEEKPMMMAAETGELWLPARDCWSHPGWKRQEGPSLGASRTAGASCRAT